MVNGEGDLMMKVISNSLVALDTYELVLESDFEFTVEPGQFLHLKTGRADLLLRRPISIAKYEEKKFYLVYKVVGDGTKALSTLVKGDEVDALGPLGKGYQSLNHDSSLIIGGGMGVAPLYQLGKTLVDNGKKVAFVLGFGSESMAYYVDKFKELGEVYLTTVDGSLGVKGHVGSVVDDMGSYDAIYSCGPLPLLNYVKNKFADHDNVFISLEERMACGIGACYACDTKDKKHRVCTDGPVFRSQEVEI